MGRIHKDDRPDAASSHSLHSIEDDLPPPYTDEPDFIPPVSTSNPAPGVAPLPLHLRLVDSAYILPDSNIKADDKRAISIAPSLSRNSDELFYAIRRQMKLPPRPLLWIKGSHTESSNDKKQKGSNSVTDFEFKLDLAETMLTGWEADARGPWKWVEEEVLNDEDYKPAFRGGRIKSRTYKAPYGSRLRGEDSDALLASDAGLGADGSDEQPATSNEANLKLWCERFCNDPSPVKSFTLHRQISGFDWKAMRNVLASHIRSLNYLGSVDFSFTIAQQSVTIYSPHWINRLRANRYIWWVFVILQLWIITWPIIWFLEKRYELVHTRWHSSISLDPHSGLVKDYARGRDEATLGEFWGPAVKRMAWSQRCGQGNTLTRMDAERVQGLDTDQLLGIQRGDSEAERERRERVNRGDAGFVDHMVGLVRGVGEVGQSWRLTAGWGANS
ncbi:hypothetical protein N7451_004453 [Penicillium sp. IBT 35674x]|nr:hypothetical protein N7451_004453 [Penicillium sp. IBT 35674x]